jgi:microcystin-dependent protein
MFHTYAFNFGLAGAPLAQGQLLPISSNTALFSLLGTNYGGDGQITFALPDLDGRTAINDGQRPGLPSSVVGQQSGSPFTSLTQSQLPASVGGTSAPVNEDGPQLAIKYCIRADGIFPSSGGLGGALNYIGSVVKFAGNFAPGGYIECNGQLLDIATYENLFSLIGTTYGGDGITTFAVPDLRGRAVVGAGGVYQIGQTSGQNDVFIGQNNLPAEMGGGQPIDNREPSFALNYIIAIGGIFPSRDGGADPYEPMLGEICLFAGNFVPSGFALCAGQLLPINQNQALFSLLGTMYGGDGRVTFALPDLRGRQTIGTGDGHVTGEVAGSNQIILTLDDIPDINHSGTGNSDTLYGGNGDDTLNGLGGADTITSHGGDDFLTGGAGVDAMNGGLGNDIYNVDNAGDIINELAGQGSDSVRSSITLTLAANVERLYLVGTAPAGYGNSLSNFIYGNAGLNFIDGKQGADRMWGYDGNDTYWVDSAGDQIFEVNATAAGGVDRVFSTVNFVLPDNVERLLLSGAGNINGTGNALGNAISGNGGNNWIDGKDGTDTASGGLGADNFLFTSAPGAANADYIYDFTSADDTMRLDDAVFTGLATGYLAAAAFHAGTSAADVSDRIIYDSATGMIYFDTDGAGGAAQMLFAKVAPGVVITNADFYVF